MTSGVIRKNKSDLPKKNNDCTLLLYFSPPETRFFFFETGCTHCVPLLKWLEQKIRRLCMNFKSAIKIDYFDICYNFFDSFKILFPPNCHGFTIDNASFTRMIAYNYYFIIVIVITFKYLFTKIHRRSSIAIKSIGSYTNLVRPFHGSMFLLFIFLSLCLYSLYLRIVYSLK